MTLPVALAASRWVCSRRPAGAPRRAEVRAATPDLTIVSDARYDVQPAHHRVRVTLALTLTNHLKDTTTTRYYFDKAFLAVLPGTSGYALSWDGRGRRPSDVSKKTPDYTILRLDLGPAPVQREDRAVPAALRHRRPGRRGDPRRPRRRFARVLPGLGVRDR